MNRLPNFLLAVFLLFCFTPTAVAQSLAAKTATLQKIDGYIPLYWDAVNGKMWMEVARFNEEFLLQTSLPAGVGSNTIGLDRGQPGDGRIVAFERNGSKVFLVQPNYRYRALGNDAAERKAVRDSFAQSVLWGFKVEASEGDKVLVDATTFFLRDAHGVIETMRRARQGSFRMDEARSAFHLPRTKSFPKNTEVEVTLTFAGDEPGRLVAEVVPTAQAVTVREHFSLVELPDRNYTPRPLDPRVGFFGISFYDYSSPFTEPIEKRWISRHRLQKKDPTAAVSEAVKPIVYYVDNGAPEPVRSALVEGAAWWNQAYEAAGFKNAFQVKVLPADADPMDIRYNTINWVHRSTRGWSYGSTIEDPRTGEIIKGVVTLDSMRIRQDVLLGDGKVPQYNGSRACDFGALLPVLEYLADDATDVGAMSLSRIRQLSAHEVGHTLGLAHNFAASSYDRASVMDYPAPLIEIKNSKLDLSNAYAVGIGAYDKFAVTFGYGEFASQKAVDDFVTKGVSAGMLFISDADTRPAGAAHPLSSLWDNGSDPIPQLNREMAVRKIGLANFGLTTIPNGTPFSQLEAKLLPLYLHHRYQLTAAVKSIGGLYYTYAVKTASGASPKNIQAIVPAATQRKALQVVLDTITPEALAIPENILQLIPPRAFGYGGGPTEYFTRRTGLTFDPIAAAGIAADLTISGLLNPERAARLNEYHARHAENPDFAEVVRALLNEVWKRTPPKNAYEAEIQRAVQTVSVTKLIDLAAEENAAQQVRAIATEMLRALMIDLKKTGMVEVNDLAHRKVLADEIERFLTRPDATRKRTAPLPTPPGDPIGEK